jgi:hypothetical protein
MPNSVARLVFRAVVAALGKVRVADLIQMVVFGEIGSDQENDCKGEPSKQDETDHHKLHCWRTRLECAKCESLDKDRFAALPRRFIFLFYHFQQSVSRDVEPTPIFDRPRRVAMRASTGRMHLW